MIIVKGREIKTLSEIISVEEQITELTFTTEEILRKRLKIYVFDATTGKPLTNVLLRLLKSNSKISAEGLTGENGEFEYIIDSNFPHILDVNRKGFITYSMEFNQTKGNEEIYVLQVPLYPIIKKIKSKMITEPIKQTSLEIKENIFRVIMISDSSIHSSQITLELLGWTTKPENNETEEFIVNTTNKAFSNDNLTVKFDTPNDFSKTIEITNFNFESKTKWFRLVGNVKLGEIVDENLYILDHNFKNRMQDYNYKVMIFDENKLISIVYAPNYLYSNDSWNIGIINPDSKKFIQINGFSKVELHRRTHLKFYLNFLKYLSEEIDEIKGKYKLGFDSESSVHKLNDLVILEKKDFISSVIKLPIQWISEKIKSEEKIKIRQAELLEFFDTLGNAFMNLFGEISFNTMKNIIGPYFKSNQVI